MAAWILDYEVEKGNRAHVRLRRDVATCILATAHLALLD